MSQEISTYSFLPWLRQGLANQIDPASLTGAGGRATVQVALKLEGDGLDGNKISQPITRNLPLYGPGDIIGVERRAIVKAEPVNGATNFEANYLPYLDFYDEDFPWRYTPEIALNNRLRPWLMLVVLKEDEFEDQGRDRKRPLPFISVDAPEAVFPPFEQLWAWAHVHVNSDLSANAEQIVSSDMNAVLPKFESALGQNPDIAYSRIMCPRKLDISTTYHAFLVPSFETGRLAGLGLDPSTTPAVNHGAWVTNPGKVEANFFPYYFRWWFKTATLGDFEYLVRLLEPRPLDSRVGRRDIDVQWPGSNLRGITDPSLAGILRLGGALRLPADTLVGDEKTEFEKYDQWDQAGYPRPFQQDLAAFINLSDDYSEQSAEDAHNSSGYDASIPDPANPGSTQTDPDPLITPPLYGRWHALTPRLLTERNGSSVSPNNRWVHQLNLDPRYRIAANYGTDVVQRNQEAYMDAAWEQVGDVLAANQRIRLAQLAKFASFAWYSNTVLPLASRPAQRERALSMLMPVQARVMAGNQTVRHLVAGSTVPRVMLSTQARRIMRPGGRVMKGLTFDTARTAGNLIDRVNKGEVSANPPKAALEGAPTLNDLADAIEPDDNAVPGIIKDLLRRMPKLLRNLIALALILCVAVVLLFPLGLLLIPIIAILIWFILRLMAWQKILAPSESLRETNQTPESVNELPKSPDFRLITQPDDRFRPTTGAQDSLEAIRYKTALRQAYSLLDASRKVSSGIRPVRRPLNLAQVTEVLVTGINPRVVIPRHTFDRVKIPLRIRGQLSETFVEAMAYPEFDIPMYEPLVKASEENFLPNLRFIEQNTISLLETNRAFIEAYMVGLNHEFARELLWREYPTDQRGSYFRQFWDPSAYLDTSSATDEQLREKLKDIPPLHRWPRSAKLGTNNHRKPAPGTGEVQEDLVLVIRGELLKRYPGAVIYAHKAQWQFNEDGSIKRDAPRVLVELDNSDKPKPSMNKIKTPLYEARVDPDITFFGFDLRVTEALGGTGENNSDPAGWFFIIEERPGEPRFGLDIDMTNPNQLYTWNDMGWGNAITDVKPGDMLQITSATPSITLKTPPASANDGVKLQAEDDKAVTWHKDTHSAELAYILYQVPVMVAVHAAEMLPKQQEEE